MFILCYKAINNLTCCSFHGFMTALMIFCLFVFFCVSRERELEMKEDRVCLFSGGNEGKTSVR